ncbi:MAG: SLBB domain-containing protein [Pyrinomonadaceae bacterium]|nr:SLBB domain-containing protein [Pyrinomonadaceae bacterium]
MKQIFLLTLTLILLVQVKTAQVAPDAERGYLVGPGDVLTVKVLGEPQFDTVARIDEDGKFQVPFFEDRIYAKCRSERELREDVTQLLSRFLKSPQISVSVTEKKSRPPATIYGAITQPQQVDLRRKATLMELISISGGVTEEAGGMIQIFRTQPPICAEEVQQIAWKQESENGLEVPSRMYSLNSLRLGREEANPEIYPGDIIVVLKASPVYITGEVLAPQGIYLKDGGLSLTEAIAKIGGVRREAKTKDIKIYRLKDNSREREIIAVNYDLIKKGEQKDVMLEPYDIVEVDKAGKGIGQTILEIITGAGRTGISAVTQGLGTRVLY